MIKTLLNTLKIDFKVAFKNSFMLIIIIMAIIYILLINFVLPEKLEMSQTQVIAYDSTSQKIFENNFKNLTYINDKDKLKESLLKNESAIGIILKENTAEIVLRGYESQTQINNIKAIISNLYSRNYKSYEIITLGKEVNKLSFNKKMLPVLIATDVIMMGFLFIAAMLFQEKQEGSISAYRVTPAGTINYILSKVLINSFLAIIFGIIVAIFTIGFQINYIIYTIIIFISAFLVSLFGLFLAQFYSSISDFIYIALIFNVIAALPVMGYFNPSLYINIFKYIPSYPVMFGIDTLMTSGDISNSLKTLIVPIIELLIISPLTYITIKRNLIRR
ncbi:MULTISPECIES: ABC transporter permease [Oceanotoga]|uniref:ABC transporter permease n=1 Tax=Oceanotoga TaxID=1255275 RepID=UPI00264BC8AD|nr:MULTISPECIES: ABC transporter permease [Oceanotoga]MDN5342662.1 type transport system permease protein [Oceanotoga sp.]MDO7975985.1 ABC transporter permease [Oceanotoga teriensis]